MVNVFTFANHTEYLVFLVVLQANTTLILPQIVILNCLGRIHDALRKFGHYLNPLILDLLW